MQAIPSMTSLARTALCTSSVMSVTVSPPAVRRRVSCWNTFIAVAILRESLPDSRGEPSDLSGSCAACTLLQPRENADRDERPVGARRRLGAGAKLLDERREALGERVGLLGGELEEPVADERAGT